MANGFRLLLIGTILVASASVGTPAGQVAGQVMTTQTDPACLAKCAGTRDRAVTAANKLAADKEYYSVTSSNCWSLADAPNCPAVRQACRDACAPTYDNACMAACEPPFQACCAANDKTRAEREFDSCVAVCPMVPVQQIERRPEFTEMVNTATKMMQALGPNLEGFNPTQYNDVRRALAFMQVRASMAVHGSKFAVISGGAGRLWVMTADGRQVPLDGDAAALARGLVGGEMYGAAYQALVADLVTRTGLTKVETEDWIRQLRLAQGSSKGFKPGETLEFLPWQGAPTDARASSEHASIRGTINGGGDFI